MTRREWMALVGATAPCLYSASALPNQAPSAVSAADPRNIRNGSVMLNSGYADQPYVAITKDGNWTCVVTTGKGVEGEYGQHIMAVISQDKGKTWSEPIDIEPANGP